MFKWIFSKIFDLLGAIFKPLFEWLGLCQTEETKRVALRCVTAVAITGILSFTAFKIFCVWKHHPHSKNPVISEVKKPQKKKSSNFKDDKKLKKRALHLLFKKKYSQSKVSKMLGVSQKTLRIWIKSSKYKVKKTSKKIVRKSKRKSKSKYKKVRAHKPTSRTPSKRSYGLDVNSKADCGLRDLMNKAEHVCSMKTNADLIREKNILLGSVEEVCHYKKYYSLSMYFIERRCG